MIDLDALPGRRGDFTVGLKQMLGVSVSARLALKRMNTPLVTERDLRTGVKLHRVRREAHPGWRFVLGGS